MRIGAREIGAGHPVFVIAEISANHNGSIDRARDLVRIAADAGADAVKLQTYTADSLTLASDREQFVIGPGTPWSGRRLHDLYAEAAMPWEWHPELAALAAEVGIELFSSPFDATAVDFLVDHGCPALKIASFELVDLPLIAHAAATGLPLVMSTGMATSEEIDEAVACARSHGSGELALLRCNSAYPAPVDQMDLATIADMAARWDVPVGLSDHTLDPVCAVTAVALGASIIEKHVTLRRSDGGPDADFSLEPDELVELVRSVRAAESAIGSVRYGPSDADRGSLAFRRSLHVTAPVAAGQAFTPENLRSVRPAGGLAPKHLDEVLGQVAVRDVDAGEALTWDLVTRETVS